MFIDLEARTEEGTSLIIAVSSYRGYNHNSKDTRLLF